MFSKLIPSLPKYQMLQKLEHNPGSQIFEIDLSLVFSFITHIAHTSLTQSTMPSYSKILLICSFISAAVALPTPQLAGEGQAADSLFTDTDNGVGFGIKNAEDNLAALVSSTKGTAPAVPKERRQADKICNGFQDLSNAVGTGSSTTAATQACDNLDGELTSGAANAGASVGSTEASTLEGLGSAVPRL